MIVIIPDNFYVYDIDNNQKTMNPFQSPGEYLTPSARIVLLSASAILCVSAKTESLEEFEISYE